VPSSRKYSALGALHDSKAFAVSLATVVAIQIDREIFSAHGHINVEHEEENGLHLRAGYRNDTWGEMSTYWRFQVTGDKISRIDTGQA